MVGSHYDIHDCALYTSNFVTCDVTCESVLVVAIYCCASGLCWVGMHAIVCISDSDINFIRHCIELDE